ncbi:probable ATP-dependent RNA helicase DHX58 isoform X2 [Carcharodon carcharias]|nr:probable ATP-dependent RNA helicase DHX58 isoform X2 [Carcharodon carcharias]XP_041029295.1 probable ATP-dependent RNA helicase DHX58 isoform X2 [Carcharodon carcharias]XP_041029296.1 probable ATP-dependent RNA helicase DHX58 isoform X2 [Carcharodon carcharias]
MQIDLRDYQWEVVQPALEGKNIIIWLPTGGGKTRAAVFVTRCHLETRGGKGKVVVLVNKVPLVNQHFENEFKPALKHAYKVVPISGDSELKERFAIAVQDNHVIICTAQILQNALNSTEEEKHVDLTEFSLLIIDECHHTQKNGVYNKIMCQYIEKKHQHKKGLPQILGLTASPGTDGANTFEHAKKHILQICANMDAALITSSKDCIKELEDTVPQPVKSYDITEERKRDPFGDTIKMMMRTIHSHLDEPSIPGNLGSQIYEQAVVELEKEGAITSNRKKRNCALHLRKYNDALLINDTVRMIDALKYLEEFYIVERTKDVLDQTDRFLLRVFNEQKEELRLLSSQKVYENPKLNTLEKILLRRFRFSNSRGIIFTKTRQSTHAMLGWIKNCQSLASKIKAESLTGAGVNRQTKHMTQQEQHNVIQNFRNGIINLLVATSVAEEGLDIKECNIVIRYGLITNEIAMVQARGRARAENSTYSVVAVQGGREISREFANEYREDLMKCAIEVVQKMPQNEYLLKIRELQMEAIVSRRVKEQKHNTARMENLTQDVRFCCRDCNEAVCHASDIRIIEGMHHVNVNPNFRIYYNVCGKINLPRRFEDWEPGGSVSCRKCGQPWGMEMIYKSVPIPSLCIKNFVVELPNERRIFKQWKSVPCQIEEFNYIEFCEANLPDLFADSL